MPSPHRPRSLLRKPICARTPDRFPFSCVVSPGPPRHLSTRTAHRGLRSGVRGPGCSSGPFALAGAPEFGDRVVWLGPGCDGGASIGRGCSRPDRDNRLGAPASADVGDSFGFGRPRPLVASSSAGMGPGRRNVRAHRERQSQGRARSRCLQDRRRPDALFHLTGYHGRGSLARFRDRPGPLGFRCDLPAGLSRFGGSCYSQSKEMDHGPSRGY